MAEEAPGWPAAVPVDTFRIPAEELVMASRAIGEGGLDEGPRR